MICAIFAPMPEIRPEDLGETALTQNFVSDPRKVRLVTKLPDSADGLLTDIIHTEHGDLLFSWEAYSIPGVELYEPPLAVMIEMQERTKTILQPHLRNYGIDKRGLARVIGFGGSLGG